jgi:circadian clock protein KaiB
MVPEQTPPQENTKYLLRLYVAGQSLNGTLALRNLTRFCEHRLHGRYELRVIDVLKESEVAAADGVVATPTLIKEQPLPRAQLFGTFQDPAALARALGIGEAQATRSQPGKRQARTKQD